MLVYPSERQPGFIVHVPQTFMELYDLCQLHGPVLKNCFIVFQSKDKLSFLKYDIERKTNDKNGLPWSIFNHFKQELQGVGTQTMHNSIFAKAMQKGQLLYPHKLEDCFCSPINLHSPDNLPTIAQQEEYQRFG